jgi:hypothetical protein
MLQRNVGRLTNLAAHEMTQIGLSRSATVGRHWLRTVDGIGLEQVDAFDLECLDGIVRIRTLRSPYHNLAECHGT